MTGRFSGVEANQSNLFEGKETCCPSSEWEHPMGGAMFDRLGY
jgi:hypothetical protein